MESSPFHRGHASQNPKSHRRKSSRPGRFSLRVELLEARNLLDGGMLGEPMPPLETDGDGGMDYVVPPEDWMMMTEPTDMTTNWEPESMAESAGIDPTLTEPPPVEEMPDPWMPPLEEEVSPYEEPLIPPYEDPVRSTSEEEAQMYSILVYSNLWFNSISPDTGVSTSDWLTQSQRPTILGYGDSWTEYQVFVDGQLDSSGRVDVSGSFWVNLSRPLSHGTHLVTINPREPNYTGPGDSRTLNIDLVAPQLSLKFLPRWRIPSSRLVSLSVPPLLRSGRGGVAPIAGIMRTRILYQFILFY